LQEKLNSKTIIQNIIYNILGYIFPLVFAVLFLPIMIHKLGDERFGILNIAWILIGYFGFLDFGISKALTQIISFKLSTNLKEEIPIIFWTSILMMLGISILSTFFLIIFSHQIVAMFNITKEVHKEAINAVYVLAFSLPIVITSAGFRGLLEAFYKFKIISSIRIFLGVGTFTTPVLVLLFSNDISIIIASLVVVRLISWGIFLYYAIKTEPGLKTSVTFNLSIIKYIFSMGFWMSVSNVIGPLIIYIDRFLIGTLLSAAAITYYATPYEMITKLLLIPGAIIGVLFPAFAASFKTNTSETKNLLLNGIKFNMILLFPLILFVVGFSKEILTIWIGAEFAEKSYFILQILSTGVFLNAIAYIPFNFLQGIGKSEIAAKLNILELPVYTVLLFFTVKKFGLNGVAVIWVLRIIVDTIFLFYFSFQFIKSEVKEKYLLYEIFLCFLLLLSVVFLSNIYVRSLFIITVGIIFLAKNFSSIKLLLGKLFSKKVIIK